MTNKSKLLIVVIVLITAAISAYHFLVPAGGSSPEVSAQKIGASAATPASAAANGVPPVLAPAMSNISVPSATPSIALPSVKISSVPVAAPDAATLAALKVGLIAWKRSADLDKLDPVGAKELKAWALSDPQAIITWLSDVTEDGKSHEHAMEAMTSLLIDDSPQTALVMAESINDPVVHDNRVSSALLALALQNPSEAANAINSSGLSDEGKLRSNISALIDKIRTGELTDEQRTKIMDEIHR